MTELPTMEEFLDEAAKLEAQIIAAWREAEPTQEAMARVAVDICARNMAEVDLAALRARVSQSDGQGQDAYGLCVHMGHACFNGADGPDQLCTDCREGRCHA